MRTRAAKRTTTTTITITGAVIATPELLTAGPLLRLLHLCSPALPIGAFAYSQGLEPATSAGWVRDEETARAWIVGILESQLATLDLAVLARLYAAWGDDDGIEAPTVAEWSAFLLASRPSAELQAEERHLGGALARLVAGLGIPEASSWTMRDETTYAAVFALAARRWDVPLRAAAQGFAFAWAEAQVSAAVRVIPLGQSAGQRILAAAAAVIPAAVERALSLPADELGASSPRLAVASAAHEHQYSRLFRS
ncbi:MAG TPA: urease accessory protein UreF [Polyangia bacterium]|jgi:urease accessory protein|nr:urease accessory protein UreF [Polyangia bacterium]